MTYIGMYTNCTVSDLIVIFLFLNVKDISKFNSGPLYIRVDILCLNLLVPLGSYVSKVTGAHNS